MLNAPRSRVLVTGAGGFVGSALLARLCQDGIPATGVMRAGRLADQCVRGPALEADATWAPLLAGHEVVVHAAARVHVMDDSATDPLAAFRAVNVEGTLSLARQAAAGGVRRFIFISSVKVHGEATAAGHAFAADDRLAPEDAYAISKAEAEAGLMKVAAQTGMAVVIIRPPLVYGPGVKANFRSMMRWLEHGVPLPFGAIEHNRRSFVALDNLVDLVALCLGHPGAANHAFLVSDGEDLSTAELLRRLAAAMGVSARLPRVPTGLIEAGAGLLGRRAMIRRLCGNLQVDIVKTRRLLGWNPPIRVDEGLRRAATGLPR